MSSLRSVSEPADAATVSPEGTESPTSPGERAKRRRRAPVTYEDEDGEMDNEQLKLVQQAIENSHAENAAADVQIEQCPVFYPTVTEFQDPIKYISRVPPRPHSYCLATVVAL